MKITLGTPFPGVPAGNDPCPQLFDRGGDGPRRPVKSAPMSPAAAAAATGDAAAADVAAYGHFF